MRTFVYPQTETTTTTVALEDDSVSVQSHGRPVRRVRFADASGVYFADFGGTGSSRSISIEQQGGHPVDFTLRLGKPGNGVEGAPKLDHEAAMRGFHEATSETLRALADARPDLQATFGMSPTARKWSAIIFGILAVLAIAALLSFARMDVSNPLTLAPLLVLAILGGRFIWSAWIQKRRHVALKDLANKLATRSAVLDA